MTSVSLTRYKHMAKLLTTLIVATPFLWAAASGPPVGTIIIPNGGALPKLVDIAASSGPYTLTMIAQEIQGPGTVVESTSPPLYTELDVPFVRYTTRIWKENGLSRGVIRVKQGETLKVQICNYIHNIATKGTSPEFQVRKDYNVNGYKETMFTNLHLHGSAAKPGQVAGCYNEIYDPVNPPAACQMTNGFGSAKDGPIIQGDDVFTTIPPGLHKCRTWVYEIPMYHHPGLLWIHPHHHGSGAPQTATMSMPVSVEPNFNGGFDPLKACSAAIRNAIYGNNEIILHMTSVLFKEKARDIVAAKPPAQSVPDALSANCESPDLVNLKGVCSSDDTIPFICNNQHYLDPTKYPNTVIPLKDDPFCCNRKNPKGQINQDGNGDAVGPPPNAVGYRFDSSGQDFLLVNGVYRPTITIESGKIYRLRVVWASVMKYIDLTIEPAATNGPKCQIALYSKDGHFLRSLPRDIAQQHIFVPSGARAEVLLQCNGAGTSAQLMQAARVHKTSDLGCSADPGNPSFATHCQPASTPQNIAAYIKVVAPSSGAPDPNNKVKGPQPADPALSTLIASPCAPDFSAIPYLQDLQTVPAANLVASTPSAATAPQMDNSALPWELNFGKRPDLCSVNADQTGMSFDDVGAWNYNGKYSGIYSFHPPQIRRVTNLLDTAWTKGTPTANLKNVQEWKILHSNWHPFHMHTNPIQIVGSPIVYASYCTPSGGTACAAAAGTPSDWTQPGDYVDNFMMEPNTIQQEFASASQDGAAPFRARIHGDASHPGRSVIHCHFLMHEDESCMTTVDWCTDPSCGINPAAAKTKLAVDPSLVINLGVPVA